MTLKPFTKYICPVGGMRLGHSSHWTGAYEHPRPGDGSCVCGAELVDEESTKDGQRYRLTFESIDPHQAAGMEAQYGKGVWPTLSDASWAALSWHEVSREADAPGDITAQYESLLAWAETREQPIRNVRLLRSAATAWEPVG